MKPEISLKIFNKTSDIKFHENPPSGEKFFSCGQRDTDGRTDVTKILVDFRNFFAQAPKNVIYVAGKYCYLKLMKKRY
jgi:hypothetical protein